MNYKISTYVLLAVLAGVVIYSCGSKDSANENGGATAATASPTFCYNELSQQLSDMLKKQKMDRNSGALVPSTAAKADLERLQAAWNINCSPDDPRVIYGFTFGMTKFAEFASKVADLDKSTGQSMIGVRVYLSLKEMDVSGKMEVYQDAFLVPLDSAGNDIYDIDRCKLETKDRASGDLVLNTSIPCPNQCQ